MAITLSARLQCIADYVEPGGVVIDVGTDHAYIPIWLLQTGVSPRAYASDVKAGPLKNAEDDAVRAGVRDRLTLYLCDGLALCDPDAVDTVILAGMGGETMMGILDAAPWVWEKRLVLQPQTKLPEFRLWLAGHGLAVRDAALVHDTGRLYLVWLVGRGKMDAEAVIDPCLIEKRDPLLKSYTGEQIKRQLKQIQGMEQARNADPAALERLRSELKELQTIYKEASQWRR